MWSLDVYLFVSVLNVYDVELLATVRPWLTRQLADHKYSSRHIDSHRRHLVYMSADAALLSAAA